MGSMNPPLLLALILCDGIIREAGSNKFSLIGTFNGLWAQAFPYVHPSFAVYVVLTDGRGRVPCSLRLTALDSGQTLFTVQGQVDFRDPTGTAELVFQLRQLRFEKPGHFALEFIADGEMLGSRKLLVQQITPKPKEPPGEGP